MVVKIQGCAYDGMIEDAENGYPHEVCGVLIGKNSIITDFMKCNNLNTTRAHDRYELDPNSFNEADKWARERNLEIVGIYHSHPDHPSKPSEFDRVRAWPNWGYIIFSIQNGKFADARLWYINEDESEFEQVEYELILEDLV